MIPVCRLCSISVSYLTILRRLCTGNLLRVPESIPVSLEAAMANYKIPNLSEDEIHLAAEFIRVCLKFDHKERATAEELQKHKFLANAFKC